MNEFESYFLEYLSGQGHHRIIAIQEVVMSEFKNVNSIFFLHKLLNQDSNNWKMKKLGQKSLNYCVFSGRFYCENDYFCKNFGVFETCK